MRCLVCDSTDKWKNVDEYRLKPSGMEICMGCGFISYPSKWKSKEEILAYYRKDYRNPPNSNNFFSCQRKLQFHAAFLDSVFKEWKEKKKVSPNIFEIGSAFGMVLQWLKGAYPGSQVGGTELTLSMRRVAYHEFGLELQEDLDDNKKQDLIITYKVAEHQLDVDQELKRYYNTLNNDGYLYISVPIWLGVLNNFGAGGFDLEYYYDANHINVWSQNNFEILLQKCGFEIVKADHKMYDSTYLCKKTTTIPDKFQYDNPEENIKKLSKIKEAFLFFAEGEYKKAIEIWPNFPVAHINYIEMQRKLCHQNGWEWTKENVINVAQSMCPNSIEIVLMAADFALRMERYEECLDYANEALKAKPNTPQAFIIIINALRQMAVKTTDPELKCKYFNDARQVSKVLGQVSVQHTKEHIDFSYLYAAQLPMPNEN